MYRQKYVQPTMPKKGYSFVVAGSLQRNFGGYYLYIKYKAGPPNKISVKQWTMEYVWFICPDREIVIVRNGASPDAFYPYGDSFHECVDLNIFNDSVAKGLEFEYHMTNYSHNPQAVNVRSTLRTHPDSRVQALSDSGGLQLVSRKDKSLVIDPRKLIDFYNKNVDAGMTLDIPLSMADSSVTMRAARLQKANSELMLKLSTGPELLNIVHGHTEYERAKYREIVEDSRIPRMALGGVQFNSMLSAMSIIYSALGGDLKYTQYHVLGVFLSTYLPLLVKIANSGENPPHITSDSTSHIQSAANRAYHFQFDVNSISRRLPIGSRADIPNTNRRLPCQCKICRSLKYTDILGFADGRHVTELLALHNAQEMSRYTKQLQEACEQLSGKEYNDFALKALTNHSQLKEFKTSLDFIEVASTSGIEKARKKYALHLNKRKDRSTFYEQPKSLFGAHAPSTKAQDHEHILNLMTKMENQLLD